MFVRLIMKSKSCIDNLKRKEYINKFYGKHVSYSDNKRIIGILEKFNNAIGFKKIISYVDEKNTIHDAVINSPKDYKSPKSILVCGLNPCLHDEDIVSFTVKQEIIQHPIKEYTYDTTVIMIKFKKFLEKIFPDTVITIEYLNEVEKLTVTEFILNKFFLGLDYDKVYTVEASINRLLNDDEINDLLKVLKTITTLDISINQQYCETCSEYSNGISPYHIEIEYNDLAKLYS